MIHVVFSPGLLPPTTPQAYAIAEVNIVNDDHPGVFMFAVPSLTCKETDASLRLEVRRYRGADGDVDVKFATVDGTAKAGRSVGPCVCLSA